MLTNLIKLSKENHPLEMKRVMAVTLLSTPLFRNKEGRNLVAVPEAEFFKAPALLGPKTQAGVCTKSRISYTTESILCPYSFSVHWINSSQGTPCSLLFMVLSKRLDSDLRKGNTI